MRSQSDEKSEAELKRIYVDSQRHDIVETEFRLMQREEFINIQIRPFKKEHTKIAVSIDGDDSTQIILIENKNYRGTLKEEPAVFEIDVRDWDL